MQFIEISQTVTVNCNEIAWVSSEDGGMSSIICVGSKEYPSDIPYNSLVNMLQNSGSDKNKTMQKLDDYLSVATVTQV